MNKTEFTHYLSTRSTRPRTLTVREAGLKPRTLTYGYDTERFSWHIYVQAGYIHKLITDHHDCILSHAWAREWEVEKLRPNKRVYPDCTDAQFALLMAERDAELCFMGNYDWENSRYKNLEDSPFKAKTHIDIEAAQV